MSSIINKLNYTDDTKELIKQAIIEKGVEVEDTDTFREYAEKILEISGGGGSEYNILNFSDVINGSQLHGLTTNYDTITVNSDLTGTYVKRVNCIIASGSTYSWNTYSTGWYTSNAISPRGSYSTDSQSSIYEYNTGGMWTNNDAICIEESSGRILLCGKSETRTKIGSPSSFFNRIPLKFVYKLQTAVTKNLTEDQCKKILNLKVYNGETKIVSQGAEFTITYKKQDGTTGTGTSTNGVLIINDCKKSNILSLEIRGKTIFNPTPNLDTEIDVYGSSLLVSSSSGVLTAAEEESF